MWLTSACSCEDGILLRTQFKIIILRETNRGYFDVLKARRLKNSFFFARALSTYTSHILTTRNVLESYNKIVAYIMHIESRQRIVNLLLMMLQCGGHLSPLHVEETTKITEVVRAKNKYINI